MEKNIPITNTNTKTITYKGKVKEIPVCNSDPKLCEFFIIARMRYCKFEKLKNSEYCVYHLPDESKEILVPCPIDPSHRVLTSKLKKHMKVCNKLEEKEKLKKNEWYVEKINLVKENIPEIENFTSDDFNLVYEKLKWEELSEEEYSNMMDKIVNCYEILKNDYIKYSNIEKLNEKLQIIKNDNTFISLSGMEINMEKDLQSTKNLIKSEKNGQQNSAITEILKMFDLLDNRNIFIEFGAGRGGLSHHINTVMNDNSIHILLEREGVRYKKDRYTNNLIRVNIIIYYIFSSVLIFWISISNISINILLRINWK
jgi:tRNA:m4X modification enzyme